MTISSMIDALRRLARGTLAVTDLSRVPLPLYMRQGAGLPPPAPQSVVECSGCHTRYFARATGAAVAENGQCWVCATGAPRVAVPTTAEVERAREAATTAAEMRRRARAAVADFSRRRKRK